MMILKGRKRIRPSVFKLRLCLGALFLASLTLAPNSHRNHHVRAPSPTVQIEDESERSVRYLDSQWEEISEILEPSSRARCEDGFSPQISPPRRYDTSRDLIPDPVVFDRNSPECLDWIYAYKVLCENTKEDYLVAKALVDNVDYVDFETFDHNLRRMVDEFKGKIGDKKFIVPIESGKSSEWIFSLIRDQLKGANFEVVPADGLAHYIANHADVSTIVRFDDGIYSGTQMLEYAEAINEQVENNKLKLHIVAPYITTQGRNKLENWIKPKSGKPKSKNLQMEIEPGYQIMETLGEKVTKLGSSLFPKDFIKTLNKMYKEDFKDYPNTFFQHKVPDDVSAIAALFREGSVSCSDGKTEKAGDFDCIPYVTPPYKRGKIDYFKSRFHASTPRETKAQKDREKFRQYIRNERESAKH